MPNHRGHSRSPIQPYFGKAIISAVILTDSPSAQRAAGPDGSIQVIFTDTPGAQRASGPDGTTDVVTTFTDTPSAQRSSGPNGTITIGIALTDTPAGQRDYGPDGSANVGVSLAGDTPAAQRAGGPDGLLQDDLVVTTTPGDLRMAGPNGAVALGVSLTDTPSGSRCSGPNGTAITAAGGGVDLTDTPSGSRCSGPGGLIAIGITLAGDSPSASRFAGPDGLVAIGITLAGDSPSAGRYAGPTGLLDITAGGTDTPAGTRFAGPDGAMGIVFIITGAPPSGSRLAGPVGSLNIGVGADVIAGTTPPSASRYSGPNGEVLLAFLPSRPPYIAPTPLVAPYYSLWVADTRTGRMLWELPSDTFQWSTRLGDAGTIRCTLTIESAWDALSDQDERDPRIMLREVLTGPWRFSLVLKWGNGVVWAGPYLNMSRPSPQSVEMNGAEIGKLLSKRTLVKPGASFATDVSADTVIGPGTTKPHAAYVLINQLMQGTGNNLPISVTDPGGFGQDYRTYYGYDLANYWEKLQALSAEVDGPEIRFDPAVAPGADGDYLIWQVQIGNPHVGRNSTAWQFDSDINSVIGFDGDGSNMAFGVWSAGSGQSRDKLVAHSTDTSLLNIGWPMIEAVDTSHASETVYPVLASQSAAALAAYKQPVVAFKVLVPADADPMVGTYRVGEDFSVNIVGDPIIPNGIYTRRIAALSGTEKPWVTITDAAPLPVGST